ncbi:MAG: enoyl-CoA hydratase/isomerase family protein [Alkalilacustris sp.]
MTVPVLVRFDPDTGIGRITFNRPEVLNAADLALAEGFAKAVAELGAREGLRCVVLTGAGRAFMAGGDVASFGDTPAQARAQVAALLDLLHPAVLRLRAIEAPILAGVRGAAAGAGLSLALAADLIVAAEGARFVLAYDRIGSVPDCGGSWFLPRRLGTGRANEMMLLSRTLCAAEAQALGLVAETAPVERFDAALDAMAQRLAAGPTRAFAAWRALSDAAFGASLATHLEAERAGFLGLTASADFAEGTAAFLARRPPAFTGT